ncbi:Ig-like domain-containing protein [Psychrobacter cryohalolentis]|uniref:Ig-like domain-containing protein n=1 Tax=Psychrobacter sp. D2 TaxID=2759702 RepID=UPI0015E5BF92|nr:Ig-like domain-containing protein [Psychrobacter sp. D2]MBA2056987.1 Ig-like domain-containing protein [Psychrobacter sp. D2]
MSYTLLPTSKLFQLTFLTCALALAGCGGGDGTDIIAPAPDLGPEKPSNGSNGEDGTGIPVSAINVTPITLIDSYGKVTRTITSVGASATVIVTDGNRNPVSNALVSFQAEGVIFGTSNNTVLTNEKGEASISVKPLDSANTGSYQLSATVNYNDLTETTPGYNFSLQAIQVSLTEFTLSSTSLDSGSNTNITLKTKDAINDVYQNDVTVNFTTSCGSFDSNSVISSNQGDVSTTYKAIDDNGNLCEGAQTITATPANNPVNRQTKSINISGIEASSIFYTTTEKLQLGASNSGSSSSGQIEFTVFANGRPAANQQVEISKLQVPTDFSFVTLNNQAPRTVTSDSQGKVVVNLYPGALPGPVEIKATLKSNTSIFALSKDVSVATGRATQNGVSISLSKNVLANSVDGDTATITVRLVDRVGNPVPDGTVMSFVSEGGRVTPSCATNKGICTVEFSTQNPRPVDNRVAVIAYVEGDKAYIDKDGDNQFSAGDIFTHNIGDFFRDDNENNNYDSEAGEFVYRRGATGAVCAPSSNSQPNIEDTCDNKLSAILRQQFILGLASDSPVYEGLPGSLNPNLGKTAITRAFKMYGNSARTVSMPSGTTISVVAEDKTDYSPTVELTNGVIQVSNAEPNTTAIVKSGSTSISVSISGNGTGSVSTTLPEGSSLTVANTNVTCEAELTSGNLKLPSIINLGVGKVVDSAVSYKFEYSGCRPNDKIKLSVTTPAPAATTTTTTISVI